MRYLFLLTFLLSWPVSPLFGDGFPFDLEKRLVSLVEAAKAKTGIPPSKRDAEELADLLGGWRDGGEKFELRVIDACSKSSYLTHLYVHVLVEKRKYFGKVGVYVHPADSDFVAKLKKVRSLNLAFAPKVISQLLGGYSTSLQLRFLDELYAADILSTRFKYFSSAVESSLRDSPANTRVVLSILSERPTPWFRPEHILTRVLNDPQKFAPLDVVESVALLMGCLSPY